MGNYAYNRSIYRVGFLVAVGVAFYGVAVLLLRVVNSASYYTVPVVSRAGSELSASPRPVRG